MKNLIAVAVLMLATVAARASEFGPQPIDTPHLAQVQPCVWPNHCLLIAQATGGSDTAAAQPAPAPSLSLIKIGNSFGANGAFQFGINKNVALQGDVERELHDGQFIGGPAVSPFVLAKNGVSVLTLGAGVAWNANHGNASYGPVLGLNLGPAVQAALVKVGAEVPALDSAAQSYLDWTPPPFLSYLGQVTSLNFAVGYRPQHDASVTGNWTYGPSVTLSIPWQDIQSVLQGGL